MSRRPTGILGVYGFVFFGVFASLAAYAQGGQMQDPNHETRTPDVPGLTAATSKCGISEDGTLGSKDNPVKWAADRFISRRARWNTDALRGPTGQGLHFKRQGTTKISDGTILDIYMVEYTGIDKSIQIYLDGYHWVQPLAPKGWLCGADMNLAPMYTLDTVEAIVTDPSVSIRGMILTLKFGDWSEADRLPEARAGVV
jgi:hypothetical protein